MAKRAHAGSDPKAGWSGTRRARLAVLFGSGLLVFGLAEVGLRVFFPEFGKLRQLVVATDDARGFAPRPDTRIAFDGVFETLEQTVVWETNADGLRHEGAIGPPGQRFRIAVYGDSETFGWPLALEDTFGKQMEEIDPRVEVLNFGVPGYNVNNVRETLERTLAVFEPDLVVYLVNKNDFNAPVELTPLSYSHVLLHLRFLFHFTVGKEIRLRQRDATDRLEDFASEVDRMTRLARERDMPFLLGFLRWSNREALGAYTLHARDETANDRSSRFRVGVVNMRREVRDEPKIDAHWGRAAHRNIAASFCREISGEPAVACVPAGWQRGGRTLSRGFDALE